MMGKIKKKKIQSINDKNMYTNEIYVYSFFEFAHEIIGRGIPTKLQQV